MSVEVSGVVGVLLLLADIWAVVHILQSGATVGGKVLWTALVLLLPLLGLVIWFFAGPRSRGAIS